MEKVCLVDVVGFKEVVDSREQMEGESLEGK